MKTLFNLPDLSVGGVERLLFSLVSYYKINRKMHIELLVNNTNGDLFEQFKGKIP